MVVVQHLTPSAQEHGAVESLRHCARRVAGEYFLSHCNAPVVKLPSGRPVVQGYEISISHTGAYLALMIDHKPCGVDIELVDRSTERVAARFASKAEMAICSQPLPQNPALLIWCAKEALYKCLHRQGVDFLRDLNIVSAFGPRLTATAYGREVELEWAVDDRNLLIVNTI